VEGKPMLNRAQQLHDRARRCRELADTAMTEEGRSILFEIAQRYEHEATSENAPPRSALAEAAG
jgi:hypothetical protein